MTPTRASATSAGEKDPPKSRPNSIVELIVIVLVAIGLALAIQAFIVKPYKIPSSSMEPTLDVGQRVLVNRVGMHFGEPKIGEIMVFHPPKDAEQQVCGPAPHMVTPGGAACDSPEPEEDNGVNFIKRVVAGPGDTHLHQGRSCVRQWQARERLVHQIVRQQLGVQLSDADQDSRRSLVHDG